ncbi:MAG: hypothetical protein R2851_03265 [Caldilineaceae bacterium]
MAGIDAVSTVPGAGVSTSAPAGGSEVTTDDNSGVAVVQRA